MKNIIIIIIAVSLSSCAQYYCKPTPKSKDWAVLNTGQHFIRVQRADCGWLVTERIGFKTTTRVYEFDCLPDSLKQGFEEVKQIKHFIDSVYKKADSLK